MEITLERTNASDIAQALVRARVAAGSPAMDMVLTLLVVTDEDNVAQALKAATDVAREHPARVVGLILGDGRGEPRLDAKVRVGENASGESLLLRMSGPLTEHAESVALPLLLPDAPAVAWWPCNAPVAPAVDPIGRLARRRLTDSSTAAVPVDALRSLATHYTPGDTDLTWTRLTPWRALLAAALDQAPEQVTGARVDAIGDDGVAALLIAWLESRLKVPVQQGSATSDQIEAVVLHTTAGDIELDRIDQRSCSFRVPGSVPRRVPLGPRSLAELLAEDLRRLDADEIYGETLKHLREQR